IPVRSRGAVSRVQRGEARMGITLAAVTDSLRAPSWPPVPSTTWLPRQAEGIHSHIPAERAGNDPIRPEASLPCPFKSSGFDEPYRCALRPIDRRILGDIFPARCLPVHLSPKTHERLLGKQGRSFFGSRFLYSDLCSAKLHGDNKTENGLLCASTR